jgi:hypothetical protein
MSLHGLANAVEIEEVQFSQPLIRNVVIPTGASNGRDMHVQFHGELFTGE